VVSRAGLEVTLLSERLFYQLRASYTGERPTRCVLTPAEYAQVKEESITGGFLTQGEVFGTIWGLPIVLLPFADDPLFKQLQAMAALAGAEVTYPGDPPLSVAEYFTGGGGWRFVAGHPSRLFPIQASLQEIAA
jgi:hypothetical protein